VWEFTALSDSQPACLSRSISLFLWELSNASLSQNRSKGDAVWELIAINSHSSSSSYNSYTLSKFMNLDMQFSI